MPPKRDQFSEAIIAVGNVTPCQISQVVTITFMVYIATIAIQSDESLPS